VPVLAEDVGMQISDPLYAKTADGAYIAYQVMGDGPFDIAWQFDFYGNIDVVWEDPFDRLLFENLASFSRLILHDRRATGLSSRNVAVPNLETRAADLRAVLDAAGSSSAVLGGIFEGLAAGVLLAATDPERVQRLVWWNPNPRTVWAPDYPWGWGPEQVRAEREALEHWGSPRYAQAWAQMFAEMNGVEPPEEEVRMMAKSSRQTCTPDVAIALTEIWWETDIRALLPDVQVPTLLLAAEGTGKNMEIAEHVASLMPDAELAVVPKDEWTGGRAGQERLARPYLDEIRRFLGAAPDIRARNSVLSTVLFTDIVGSTEKQASLGDRAWKELAERHHAIVREDLSRWGGVENDTAGDGFFATFDGPARAIHCALEIEHDVRDLDIEIRAGVHIGECEVIDGKVGGIAVTTGARIASLAGRSEVLVSQTVKDLVAGSNLVFEEAGEHDLKGVPGSWRLYRAVSSPG